MIFFLNLVCLERMKNSEKKKTLELGDFGCKLFDKSLKESCILAVLTMT